MEMVQGETLSASAKTAEANLRMLGKRKRTMLPRQASLYLQRIAGRLQAVGEEASVDAVWPPALMRLALLRRTELGDTHAADNLDRLLQDVPCIHAEMPDIEPAHAVDGYNLLMMDVMRQTSEHTAAVRCLAETLMSDYPRARDECLPYSRATNLVLVDTLGMLCPFLAAYGRYHGSEEAVLTAKRQLLRFVECNVDGESHLPFHGYRADGPYRLGLHGWGRGIGWYLLGLCDTIMELPEADAERPVLIKAFGEAVGTLTKLQRTDGHWGWAPLYPEARSDASVAGFCGYAMARARRAGFLDSRYDDAIDRAAQALRRATDVNGVVTGSSGECRGLLSYSRRFGPQPWLQGTACAFLSLWPME